MHRIFCITIVTTYVNFAIGFSQIDILKIDIVDTNTVFYVTKDFIEKYERKGTLRRIAVKKKFTIGYNDFSYSMDFVLQDTNLLTLHSHKYCWNCRMEEYLWGPWSFRYELIDLNWKSTRMGVLSKPALNSINIENLREVTESGTLVEYAFVYKDADVLLILITGHNIYVYRSEDIVLNQWEHIGQTTLQNCYRNFVAYYDGDNIIVEDVYKGRFEMHIEDGIRIKTTPSDSFNIVPVYSHQDGKYYILKQSIANEMLNQENPIDYIISQIQQENYHE